MYISKSDSIVLVSRKVKSSDIFRDVKFVMCVDSVFFFFHSPSGESEETI